MIYSSRNRKPRATHHPTYRLLLFLTVCTFQMSAGLMSCVRENSPPLESPPATPGTGANNSSSNSNSGHATAGSHIGIACTAGGSILDPNDIPITITTPEHHHQGRCCWGDWGEMDSYEKGQNEPLNTFIKILPRLFLHP